MKYLYLFLTSLFLLSSCDSNHHNRKPHREKQPHRQVQVVHPYSDGSYAYSTGDVWFYMWLTDSGRTITRVETSTVSPTIRGLSVDSSRTSLERVGNKEPEENEELDELGEIESEDLAMDAEIDADNMEVDAENAEMDAADAESSDTSDGGFDSSDSGSDSGGDGGGGGE